MRSTLSKRNAMPLGDCYDYLTTLRRNEVVVCSGGTAGGQWHARSGNRDADFKISMGMASMFALGVAVAIPEATVWVFDGDGSLLMNPGALLTEAELAPPNLVHFVLANRVYGATGALPFGNADSVDFAGLATACGVERVYAFDDVATFKQDIDTVLAERHYSYVVLELTAERGMEAEIPIDEIEQKYRFIRHLERAFGRAIFNEWGY